MKSQKLEWYIKEAGLDKVLEHLTLQERGIEPQFGRVVHQQIIEMLITTIFFLIINPSLYQKGGGQKAFEHLIGVMVTNQLDARSANGL